MGKTAAFLTYNSVGSPGTYPNGAVERDGLTAIIVQHPKGEQWGVPNGRQSVRPDLPEFLEDALTEEQHREAEQIITDRESLVSSRYSEVFGLWELPDYVVVYVGARGSEGAIDLVTRLPLERLRFVLCDCGLDYKLRQIESHMGSGFPFLLCECGGQRTMGRLVEQFFATGLVGPEADRALAR